MQTMHIISHHFTPIILIKSTQIDYNPVGLGIGEQALDYFKYYCKISNLFSKHFYTVKILKCI